MIRLIREGRYLCGGKLLSEEEALRAGYAPAALAEAYKGTIAHGILAAHHKGAAAEKGGALNLRFDALASHDITYVGIIQTAKASGLERFPVPYVLTNCHNSLCAVGGTINEDDHLFGLSAAKKYGGIFVPPHMAVIHTYMRERMAGCGKMILGSDSHTRYGALGTMAIGEGGPELVKQLLERTYDVDYPQIVAVRLEGKPRKGVGPQDVALAIIGAVFAEGFVKNKVMEFIGGGVASLPAEYRNGIDVMTTETTCLSSVWRTDDIEIENYFAVRGRLDDYKPLAPAPLAYYDGVVEVDLDKIEPMIALPFHPSNVYTLRELTRNAADILAETDAKCAKLLKKGAKLDLASKVKDGKIYVDQGIIAGCAGGTYDNICEAASVLDGGATGTGAFTLSVYPSSMPVYYDLANKGVLAKLVKAGAIVKTAFCGPCFGAGDVPGNNAFSIRHTTRNFESREGSKPGEGQIASVALMDARSIAATAKNGGVLTSALEFDYDDTVPAFAYDPSIYASRVYEGYGRPDADAQLVYGPNICDWPQVIALTDHLIVKLAAAIDDPVTTTDELIPSGETSSYRSNPLRLAEFALSRKRPDYVPKAKAIYADELRRRAGELPEEYARAVRKAGLTLRGTVSLGSGVYAVKPGDGSAREQAASCQRVLGGVCNIASEYATKRYRSNLINWGMLPFVCSARFESDEIVVVPDVREKLLNGESVFAVKAVAGERVRDVTLSVGALTGAERQILADGCLMNYYKSGK